MSAKLSTRTSLTSLQVSFRPRSPHRRYAKSCPMLAPKSRSIRQRLRTNNNKVDDDELSGYADDEAVPGDDDEEDNEETTQSGHVTTSHDRMEVKSTNPFKQVVDTALISGYDGDEEDQVKHMHATHVRHFHLHRVDRSSRRENDLSSN
ncbi:hypothetical protein HDV05_003128 [Chytridiales sp. JEL 0842]|nr:hypothetical protein HDV05_003128 [Chytridiales sp. JEL 0842]